MSGSYKFNGVELELQPTSGRWMPKTSLGIDGNGHPIYSGVREYEMRWRLGSTSDYEQLQTSFDALSNTGTVIVDLPKYGIDSYNFVSYTGCNLREPETGPYFSEYQQDIYLLVTNIKT